jgi:dihydroflavonol-4-reductase
MFGAYDSKPGSGAMVISLHKGRIVGYTRGGRSYIAAKDVATCAVNALTRGVVGECYLASGLNLNFQEVFTLIAGTIGVEPPKLYIPDLLVEIVGLFGSLMGVITNNPPLISYPMARLAHTDCYYSNAKAVRELGLPQTPLRDAILECFVWFKEHDYL